MLNVGFERVTFLLPSSDTLPQMNMGAGSNYFVSAFNINNRDRLFLQGNHFHTQI